MVAHTIKRRVLKPNQIMRQVNRALVKSISDVRTGDVFTSPTHGEGVVISVTKRTITVSFDKSTSKNTYKSASVEYPLMEF